MLRSKDDKEGPYYLRNENGTVDDKHVEMIESGHDGATFSFTRINVVPSIIIVPIKTST